ncbi:MAG: hypothetical protein JXA96_09165 [Sedimentisphaerales bacterium]|nr:hypothetical protein [Sedimentisphaerales bacterium]
MLKLVLKLLKPAYALTVLAIFMIYNGYSFVDLLRTNLHASHEASQVQDANQSAESSIQNQENPAEMNQNKTSPAITVIRQIHPVTRIVSWTVLYILLCLATVPIIKKMLTRESNLVNLLLVLVYAAIGTFLAFVFTAFQLTGVAAVSLVAALVCSSILITWLAGELEKLRVEDSLR